MSKIPEQAALIAVEIIKEGHHHNSQECSPGDTINIDQATAGFLARHGVIKPLPPATPPEQTAVSATE
jgi:hypothetical protein